MSHSQPAQSARRPARSIILAVLVAVVALIGLFGCRAPAGPSSTTASPIAAAPLAPRSHDRLHADFAGEPPGPFQGDGHRALGAADGEVPDGVTVFDDGYPAVTRLEPGLLGALRSAATGAARDGVEIDVNSGWRSRRYQEQLFEQGVSKYGSEATAARWVARPGTSVHEAGGAVDIGPDDAASWLSEHGSEYGLCQTYSNEPWHYELRPDAIDHGCPDMYADPTQDPRMQR